MIASQSAARYTDAMSRENRVRRRQEINAPGHAHEQLDPRWAALTPFRAEVTEAEPLNDVSKE